MKEGDKDGGEWGRKAMVGSSLSEGSQVWVGAWVVGGLVFMPLSETV